MAPGTHWSELSFKNVNLKSMGAPVGGGNFHPLLKVSQISICSGLKFKKGYLRKRYRPFISDPFLPLSLLSTLFLSFLPSFYYSPPKLLICPSILVLRFLTNLWKPVTWMVLMCDSAGQSRISTHIDGNGIRGNAHEQMGGKLFLEFWCPFPASVTSC